VPDDGNPGAVAEPTARGEVRRGHVLFRAPPIPAAFGLLVGGSLLLAALVARPFGLGYWEEFLFVFAGPALVAGGVTPPLARALGGRFEFHRSILLAALGIVLMIPLAAAWAGAARAWPNVVPSTAFLVPFVAAPVFWFRHLSVFGVGRSSHARMLPASIAQPLLTVVGAFALAPPGERELVAAVAFFVLAFVCALVVLHASDRPIRREFQQSGVSLIRPLLDHVGQRDPEATRALEAFFLKSTVLADLKVSLLAFGRNGRVHATIALPAVHPGPFAALGASDLPRKLTEHLGPDAGTVLVPHTPSDHDLDLPSDEEMGRVGAASRALLGTLTPSASHRASPLVLPYPGSLARAQILGDVALVVISQAPAPTDDIAYAVADRIVRELARPGGPSIALVDAHNSYVEGKGDVSYGSPEAERLVVDAKAAVDAALAAARDGPIEVGVAVRTGYTTGGDGIGPAGLRALAVRAAGTTTGYVLIDGNNLILGERDPIVAALLHDVDAAEVMTTDNHVVHEVDGGINPVGERCPRATLVRDAQAVLRAAIADLAPADVRFGSTEVRRVKVLGPGYTARLLTSLGDTLSMFTNMFPASLILLLTSALVIALLLR